MINTMITRMILFFAIATAAAFGQTQASRFIPLKGTTAPATCTVGELFFDTDATAGQNLHACTATNTWTLQAGGGSGASAVPDLTDCKTTVAGDVITVAACRVYGLGTSFYESYSLAGGTVTRSTGTESADIYIVANYNGGSPILKAIIGTGITLGNYASSGITRVSANVPEAGDKVLSLVSVSSGVIGAPSERRGMFDVSTFTGGTGISIAGRTITATTAVQAQERVMHVKWWGTGASSVLQDTDDELTVFRNRYTNSITINSVVCETDTGTPTVQLQKDDGSATNMLSSNLTCDGTPTTTFVSGENTMAAGDRLDGLIVSAGGSAHWVAITVNYTVN